MNKNFILGLCKRITASSDKSEREKLATQLLTTANAMGEALTHELANEIVAALKPEPSDVHEDLMNDLNESLRKEGDFNRRAGILTAMMRLRNGMKIGAS